MESINTEDVLGAITFAQTEDMLSGAIAGIDMPLRIGEVAGGGGGGGSVRLPFQAYIASADDTNIYVCITKGYVNGSAYERNIDAPLVLPSSFAGIIYLKYDSNTNIVSFTTDYIGDDAGYLDIARISDGVVENLRTTSFNVLNCNNNYAFYAV